MPKIIQPQKRVEPVSELLNNAHAHRIAIGWLVSREAGLDHDATGSPFGGQAMEKWSATKNLPGMLKAFKTQSKLFYRIRALCLHLHDHPNAMACGGAEQWWQRILEEDILQAIVREFGPVVLPELSDFKPPTTAASIWWMRRGVNPFSSKYRPATWALTEAVQARVFRWRPEVASPSEAVPLPIASLSGEMSLQRRKQLLKSITGRQEGRVTNSSIELWSDWRMMLNAWQSTSKEAKTESNKRPVLSSNPQQEDFVASVVHEAVTPSWWANIYVIHDALEQISKNKHSACNGSDGLKTFEEVEPTRGVRKDFYEQELHQATKKELFLSANLEQLPHLLFTQPQGIQKIAMSNPITSNRNES